MKLETVCAFVWIVLGALVLILFDRLALAMESRGWIHWRRSRGMSSRLGNAFLELQSIIEPDKKYIIEAKHERKRENRDTGDPPS